MLSAQSTSNGRKSKRPKASRRTPPASPTSPASDTLDSEELLAVLTAVRRGDFSVRMPATKTGVAGKVADLLNDIVALNEDMAREFERVGRTVGKEGRITQRAHLPSAGGAWAA